MKQPKSITERKHNYWRGFRSALIVTVPVIIALMVIINKLINIALI